MHALNRPASDLPSTCDVLVVGAGPAGSAAASVLARAGVDVVLADSQAFPRDKVCGDGLIPDAHHAMRRLGVLDAVMAAAQVARHVGCIGPSGRRMEVPGSLAVLPRRELDLILCRAAAEAGARMHAPLRFTGVIEREGRVVGASLDAAGQTHAIRAQWVLLATGAVPQALMAAGMCTRRTPSGIALRGYVRHLPMVDRIRSLDVIWHRRLRHGYGWIFPCPEGVFNIGVGVAHSHAPGRDGRHAMQDVNLREMFRTFCEVHPPARELLREGEPLGELKGAPLRCSLDGARWTRPGLIVTGEAAGSTYGFTGEGIGKAMETGMHAAESVLMHRADWADHEARVRDEYEARLQSLKPRFEMYERANRVNAYPWLVDLLIWSARRNPQRLVRMSGVLNETNNPGNLVSARGILRALLAR